MDVKTKEPSVFDESSIAGHWLCVNPTTAGTESTGTQGAGAVGTTIPIMSVVQKEVCTKPPSVAFES